MTAHFISCSSSSNSGAEKNSPSVISRPSQSFLTVETEISRLLGSSRLYTVDGVTPEMFASEFGVMPRSPHSPLMRCATASLTHILSPH